MGPDEVIPLAAAVYSREEGGGAGCCLHIALDDGNLSDGDIMFCFNHAVERGHFECIATAAAMLLLTQTQRTELYDRYREYC